MSLLPLTALRDRLSADVGLVAFWQEKYGKDCKHFIGYKKAAAAHDYPFICYVPTQSKRGWANTDQYGVSMVFGVNDQGFLDAAGNMVLPADVPGAEQLTFAGVARLAEIEDLILAALVPAILQPGLALVRDSVETVTDLGLRHPFYECEMKLRLQQYDVAETGTAAAQVWLHDKPEIGVPFQDAYDPVYP